MPVRAAKELIGCLDWSLLGILSEIKAIADSEALKSDEKVEHIRSLLEEKEHPSFRSLDHRRRPRSSCG